MAAAGPPLQGVASSITTITAEQVVEVSLYDSMRQHGGTSQFMTKPIEWTDLHVQVLDVCFQELPPCNTPVPSSIAGSRPSEGHMKPSPEITKLSDALSEILAPYQTHSLSASTAVKDILRILWPVAFSQPRERSVWSLHFGKHIHHGVINPPLTWNFPADLPMLCYIDPGELAEKRAEHFSGAHDAYFVGVFLVMAQRHYYDSRRIQAQQYQGIPTSSGREEPQSPGIKLRILTQDRVSGELIIYTAYVTARFLQRLHDPAHVPDGFAAASKSLKIEYTRVPAWPILGLRERLGDALGPEVVGPVDKKMVTWLPSEAKPETPAKRKLQSHFDVVNSSYEDKLAKVPILSRKKPCLRKPTQAGVMFQSRMFANQQAWQRPARVM